jgi:hypothetical protein
MEILHMSPSFPRGIEVLLKKAAIDPQFREVLLNDPEAAAKSIELELTPIEQAMLQNMPTEQLAVIINQTDVPQQQRRAFLGTAAAAMLAVLTGFAAGCPERHDRWPPAPGGVNPGLPDMPEDDSFTTSDEDSDYRHDWVGGAAPDLPEDDK